MIQNLKRLLVCIILSYSMLATASCSTNCTTSCNTSCVQSQNLMQFHSFGVSAARELYLEKHAWMPNDDEEGWHGMFGVSGEYMRTWKNCTTDTGCCTNIGSRPFWQPKYSNQMTVGDNSGDYDLDGYQMGLGPITTSGTVQLNPIVYQTGADFLLYLGAHRIERGFWIKIHAPVGVMGINPKLSYSDTITPVNYPQGSLSNVNNQETTPPYANIKEAFKGNTDAGFYRKMTRGRIDCQLTSSAKFGDPEFSLGYNVVADEKKHLGIGIRFSAPTGNKALGVYVFEPIFGRNGHWGAGAEIISHWRFWESDVAAKHADLWFQGDVLHLFKSKHARSFDLLNNGLGSKYLMIAKYTGNSFQSEIINAVNITTIGIESTFAAEGNFAIGLDFHWNSWSLLFGYEGWGRTQENINADCSCPGSTNFNDYAVLGRQTPYSSADGTTAINLCEPGAKIGKSAGHSNTATSTIVLATNATNRIPDDVNLALNICGQCEPVAYTSKPFVQIQHTWVESDYKPFIAFSGSAEFSNTKNAAANFWSVGAQGGIAF